MKRQLGIAFLVAVIACPAAAADRKPDPAREAYRRLQAEKKTIEQEKARLAQEKAAADDQVKAVSARAESARRQAATASRRIEALEKDLAAAQSEKDGLATRLSEAEQQLARMAEQQRATDAERLRLDGTRVRLEALVAEHKQLIAVCEDKNSKLYAQGMELAERYRTKTCFDSTLQREPFTGLRRIEIENAIEDSRDKLDEHKLESPGRAPAAAAGAG